MLPQTRGADVALSRKERFGALLLAGCFQFFVAEQIVRLGWQIPYSFTRNYISDLGAVLCGPLICSPWHVWMNLSFGLQGVLIAAGVLLEHRRLGRPGVVLLVACGLGLIGVAVAPEDVSMQVHVRAAVVFFLGGGLGFLAVGVQRGGVLSVLLGVIVIAATMAVGDQAVPQVGAMERVAAYAISGWMVAMGASLLRRDAVSSGG